MVKGGSLLGVLRERVVCPLPIGFGELGMCTSHWRVVKEVMQPRTWKMAHWGGGGLSTHSKT